jgi:hypothetical protein
MRSVSLSLYSPSGLAVGQDFNPDVSTFDGGRWVAFHTSENTATIGPDGGWKYTGQYNVNGAVGKAWLSHLGLAPDGGRDLSQATARVSFDVVITLPDGGRSRLLGALDAGPCL